MSARACLEEQEMLGIELADELDRFLLDLDLEAGELTNGVQGFAQLLLELAHVAAVEHLLLLVLLLELWSRPKVKK